MTVNRIKYNGVFMDMFGCSESTLHNLRLKESENWDSVGHIGLISALEDIFDINLDADDMFALISYQEGMRILKKYGIDF